MNKDKEYKERIVRWQQLSIKQLSFVNNLFISLSLVFFGFLINNNFLKFNDNKWLFFVQILSLLTLSFSFILGVYTTMNRLYDFRLTTDLVRKRKERLRCHEEKRTSLGKEIDYLILKSGRIGKRTWLLLKWQVGSFVIGVLCGVLYSILIDNLV